MVNNKVQISLQNIIECVSRSSSVKRDKTSLKKLHLSFFFSACFHQNFRKATGESHYDVLGVPLYASDKEIRKAFIELSKKVTLVLEYMITFIQNKQVK